MMVEVPDLIRTEAVLPKQLQVHLGAISQRVLPIIGHLLVQLGLLFVLLWPHELALHLLRFQAAAEKVVQSKAWAYCTAKVKQELIHRLDPMHLHNTVTHITKTPYISITHSQHITRTPYIS